MIGYKRLLIYLLIKIIHGFETDYFVNSYLELDTRQIVSNCAISVARTYFSEGSTLTISLASSISTGKSLISTDNFLLHGLYNEMKWPISVNKAKETKTFLTSNALTLVDNYVLQVRNTMEFEQNLNHLIEYHSWNPHANFLVMLNAIVENSKEFISYFLERLWKRQVINAVVMVHNATNPTQLHYYTWYPYTRGHCGKNFKDPTIVGECLHGVTYSTKRMFAKKIPRSLNGCTIRVQACILQPYIIRRTDQVTIDENNAKLTEGVEVKLMEVIAKQLNFTPKYQISEKFNTLTYTLKQMALSKADISIGAISPDNEKHKQFDYTHSYLDESATWCVPKSLETPRWKNFIFSFSFHSWLLIFFSYILCSILTWYLSRNNILEVHSFRKLGILFLWNFSILISIPIPNQPRQGSARYIVFPYILFCFIANVTFQTFLMSVLTEPIFEKQITNFDELIQSDLEFGIMESHRRFYEEDPKYEPILAQAKICDDVNSCLYNVSYHKNLAVAIPRLYMNYIGYRYLDSKGRHLIHAFKSDIVTYPIEMLMTKGFPLLENFNIIILYLKETGLLSKWRNDYLSETSSIEDENEVEDENIQKALTLEETQIAYLTILIGFCAATLVFILELCCKRHYTPVY